jgi:hypothetical protein
MTEEAGPASLPDQSRLPISCSLEEHVRYSGAMSCPSGDEWDDPSYIPLFPPATRTRREVRTCSYGQIAPRLETRS